MKHQSSLARVCACLLLAMAGAHAHARQAPAAAADPHAAVPATEYRSVLGHKPDAAPEASPDRNWTRANDSVAATDSMSLTMKGMGAHANRAGHEDHGAAPATDPHAGHTGHAGHDMKKDKETP